MSRVSIIIPTYNYAEYIQKAIDSVLAQTYKNCEIIVVDDGSTDNTQEIIENKYKNKVRYYYQENKGAPAARNKGIKKSKGEYLSFLDADDYLTESSIENRLTVLEQNKSIAWVYSKWLYLDTQGNIIFNAFRDAPFLYKDKCKGNVFLAMLGGALICTPTVLVRKICVEEIGGFDERLTALQDYDLWLRVSHLYPIEYIDEVLAYVLIHEGSISTTQSAYPSRAIINEKIEKNYGGYLPELGFKWRRIKAGEYNYWGEISLKKGKLKEALKYYSLSLRKNPFQKQTYYSFFSTFLKRMKFP